MPGELRSTGASAITTLAATSVAVFRNLGHHLGDDVAQPLQALRLGAHGAASALRRRWQESSGRSPSPQREACQKAGSKTSRRGRTHPGACHVMTVHALSPATPSLWFRDWSLCKSLREQIFVMKKVAGQAQTRILTVPRRSRGRGCRAERRGGSVPPGDVLEPDGGLAM